MKLYLGEKAEATNPDVWSANLPLSDYGTVARHLSRIETAEFTSESKTPLYCQQWTYFGAVVTLGQVSSNSTHTGKASNSGRYKSRLFSSRSTKE